MPVKLEDNIRYICYSLYKVDWITCHIHWTRQLDEIKKYWRGLANSEHRHYSFDKYIQEFGYDYELYVSYDEFLNTEYLDKEYIKGLLKDDDLIDMYIKDVEKYEM